MQVPWFIGIRSFQPATVTTVKCPSDHNICGHSYNCLTFNGRISPLHSTLKLKKLFSVRIAVFRNPNLLCCVSFCFLGKILLVSPIQTAFAMQAQAVWLCETRQDGLSALSPCCEETFSARTLPGKHHCSRRGCFRCRALAHFACSFQREEYSLISIKTSVSFIR